MEQFIIKLEWEKSFNKMTDEQKGIFLQVFFDYHNKKELNFKGDIVVECVWWSLEPNIIRINDKFTSSVENGKKGGRPKQTQPKPNNNPIEPNHNQPITLKEKEKEKEKVIVFTSEEVKTNNTDLSTLGGYGKFLENFPHTKVRNIMEGKELWETYSQEEKQEIFRHSTIYIKDMVLKKEEQYMKNSFAYLEAELWLNQKPRSFVKKAVERGMKNMTFITFYSQIKNIKFEDADTFLYRTSTDDEFSKAFRLYQDHKNKIFNN